MRASMYKAARKAARDNRSRQLNPKDEQYWRSRGGHPPPSEGGGWSSLLTAVGVAAAAVAAVAVGGAIASVASQEPRSLTNKDENA